MAQVNYDWGTGAPRADMGADSWALRLLSVPVTEARSFTVVSDGGILG